ncbi:MAG: LysM peptidoglycan-binding domain-containing protein [Chloroflexi bacterium]|nr:LysM peptidoglycan-binding domain-containing protein [Chloroflexota bacterium]
MNTQKKTRLILVIAIVIAMLALSSCERSYAPIDESAATPVVQGEGFATPLAADSMELVELGAQTAIAGEQTATALAAGVGDDAPAKVTEEAAPVSEDPTAVPEDATVTPEIDPTLTPTAIVADPPVVGKPASYTLKKGEFPYCIARRFNVDPTELLNLNSLSSAQAQSLQPGLTLSIPQSGKAFPSTRALHAHPVSYTVPSNTTVYGIACFFGDVDPAAIVSRNNIANPNNVAAGTVLQID